MSTSLESNVILRSQVTGPTGTGFANLKAGLQKLEMQLKNITDKTYLIKFALDDAGLRSAQIQVIGKQAGVTAGKSFASGMQGSIDQMMPSIGRNLKVKTTRTIDKEGNENISTLRTQERIRGGNRVITTQRDEPDKKTQETINLKELERVRLANAAAKRDAAALVRSDQRRQLTSAILSSARGEDLPRNVVETASSALQEQVAANRKKAIAYYKKIQDEADRKLNEEIKHKDTVRRLEALDVFAAIKREDDKVFSTQKATGSTFRRGERKAAVSAAEREAGAAQAKLDIAALQGEGYKKVSTATRVSKTGFTELVSEFQKVERLGIGQFDVKLARVNETVGGMSKRTLSAAEANRRLGDSFVRNTEKVGLWLASTGAVFTFVRGLQEALRITMQLEEATVLLARVSKNFGGNTTRDRIPAAKQVQRAVLDFATVTGGDPEEAMRAATVFARAGQNVRDTISSVKASMLAAKIAELDVMEAANLLSAAYLQFGADASQVLPILNQLNVGSNNFRVTTDDLLQSISRAGSVIAQQNGRLTELAAVTAVTGQATTRTGAEIGNAMKTIASNLERVETKGMLFDKLQISTHDMEGATKSYTQMLLDMNIALNQSTEAERNQVAISAAGVRQRNILLVQLRNVVDMIAAENQLIMQSQGYNELGSAFEELMDTSQTLTSHLNRLKAEAIRVSQDGGGPLMEMAKDVTIALTLMLKLLSSGNGVPAYLLTLAVAAAGVVKVMSMMKGVITQAAAANISLALSQVYAALTGRALAVTMGTSQHAIIGVMAATRALGASLLMSLGPYAAVAAILYVVMEAMSAYETALIEKSAVEANAISFAEKSVEQEHRKTEAYKRTALHISRLTVELQRLQATEAKSPTVAGQEKITEVKKSINTLVKSFNLSAGGSDEASRVIAQEYAKQFETEHKARLRSIEINKEQMLSKKHEQVDLRTSALNAAQEWRESGTRFDTKSAPGERSRARQMAGRIPEIGGAADKAEVAEEIFNTIIAASKGNREAAIQEKKYKNEFDETLLGFDTKYGAVKKAALAYIELDKAVKEHITTIEKESLALNSTAEDIDRVIKEYSRWDKLKNETIKSTNEISFKKFTDKGTAAIRDYFGDEKDFDALAKDIAKVTNERNKMQAEADYFKTGALPETIEQLRELDNVIMLLKNDMDKLKIASMSAFAKADIKNFSKMQESRIVSRFEAQSALNNDPAIASDLNRLRFEQAAANENIGTNMSALNTGEAKDLQSLVDKEELRKAIKEDYLRLSDMEINKVIKLNELEAKITIERKKSTDELARSLGILSDVDKMRAFAQAAYFTKNPKKTLSIAEQIGMRSEDVKISEMLGRTEKSLNPKNTTEKIFLDAYRNLELEKSERTARQVRGGRSDAQLEADAMRNSRLNRNLGDTMGGGMAVKPSYKLSGDYGTGGEANQPRLDVRANLDLIPLVNEFSKILSETGQTVIKEAREKFRDDFNKLKLFQQGPRSANTEP